MTDDSVLVLPDVDRGAIQSIERAAMILDLFDQQLKNGHSVGLPSRATLIGLPWPCETST